MPACGSCRYGVTGRETLCEVVGWKLDDVNQAIEDVLYGAVPARIVFEF